VQRRRAVTLRRVDVGVCVQERQDRLPVTALYRVSEQGLSTSGTGSGAGSGNAKQRGEP